MSIRRRAATLCPRGAPGHGCRHSRRHGRPAERVRGAGHAENRPLWSPDGRRSVALGRAFSRPSNRRSRGAAATAISRSNEINKVLYLNAYTCYALSRERSEEHTSELQSLMRISYAVFCLKKKISKTKCI